MRLRTALRFGAVTAIVGTSAFAWPVASQSQTTERIPTANAQSTIGAIVPRAGSIPLTVAFGNAAADLSGGRTRGRANDADMGLVGSIATSESCGRQLVKPEQLPAGVLAASPDGPPTAERDRASVPQGPNSNVTVSKVLASAKPGYADASANSAAIDIPGLVTTKGGRSAAVTRVIDGTREAIATADFSEITIGPVVIGNMHTEAFNRTGNGKNEHGTKFTVGSITIASIKTEPPANASPATILDPINTVLKPLGLQMLPPKATYEGSTQRLSPVELFVGKGLISETAVSPLLEALQPARDQFDQRAAGICGAPAVLTVADVALALAAGSGSLGLQFGGVEATSGEIEAKNPFGTFTPPPVTTPTKTIEATPAIPEQIIPGVAPSTRTIAGNNVSSTETLSVRATRAALALLLTLLFIALLAGRDYLVMRTNSRNLMEGK